MIILFIIFLFLLFLAHIFVMCLMGLSLRGAFIFVILTWIGIAAIWIGMAMLFGLTLRYSF
jgi:hypothetical protein